MKRYIVPVLTLLLLGWTVPVHAENLEQMQRLLSTRECSQCDLSRAGLVYSNLSNVDLNRANLSHANLSRANLSGANLSHANLSGANLFNANLTGADLSGADLSGADLRGAVLTGANLQNANVESANFLGAIGLPTEVATPEMIYRLGLAEAERGNYRAAVHHYSQAVTQEPTFAHAYLARSISRFHLGDPLGAMEDAQWAEQLYSQQGHEVGLQAATQVVSGIHAFQEATEKQQAAMRGGNGIGIQVLNVLGSVASMLLRFGLP
jgi:tetratricopeptide (TPR) repeat protein